MDVQLPVVPDCPNEHRAGELLRRALTEAGIGGTQMWTVVVTTAEQAEQLRFPGSPTIMLDGADPFPSPDGRTGVACRVYTGTGGPRGVPELSALTAAIRRRTAPPSPLATVDIAPALDRRRSAAKQAATNIAAGR